MLTLSFITGRSGDFQELKNKNDKAGEEAACMKSKSANEVLLMGWREFTLRSTFCFS